MSTFHVTCEINNTVDRSRSTVLDKVLVDTGSEFTWVSEKELERIGIQQEKKDVAFVMANGERITRRVGFAIVRVDKYFTIDEVVFAEPGDLTLLGARTLEGLNLAAGPVPAAANRVAAG
jgi:predicted aspartyl protease